MERDEYHIMGHEVHSGEVKEFGSGAHVTVPKDWLGDDVKIIRTTDSSQEDEGDE